MSIKEVALNNWKGQTHRYTIGPLTLFVGGNGSGKSAVLSGIQFGCTGQVSQIGRTLDDAAVLAASDGGAVEIQLADNYAWTRSLSKTEKGVKSTLKISNVKERGLRKLETQLKGKIGDFAPAWNMADFLSLSPDKRRDFIVGLCGSDLLVPTAHLVHSFGVEWLKIHPDLSEKVVDAMVAKNDGKNPADMGDEYLSKQEKAAFIEINNIVVSSIADGGDMTEMILSALESVGEIKRSSAAQAESSRIAAQELSQRKLDLQAPAGSVEEARERSHGLKSLYNNLFAQQKQQIEREKHRASLKDSLDIETQNWKETKARVEETKIKIKGAKEDIKAATSEYDRLRVERGVAMDNLNTARESSLALKQRIGCVLAHDDRIHQLRLLIANEEKALDRLSESILPTKKNANQIIDEHNKLTAQLERLRGSRPRGGAEESLRTIIQEQKGLSMEKDFLEIRAHCTEIETIAGTSSTPPGVIRRVEKIREIAMPYTEGGVVAKLEALKHRKVAAERAQEEEMLWPKGIDETKVLIDNLTPYLTYACQFRDITKKVDVYHKTIKDEKSQIGDMDVEAAREGLRKAQKATDDAHAELDRIQAIFEQTTNPNEIKNRVNAAKGAITDMESWMAKSNDRIVFYRSEIDSIPDPVDDLEEQVQALQEQIIAATESLRIREEYEILEGELSACSARAVERQILNDVATRYEKAIKRVREMIMVELTSPLRCHMNTFLSFCSGLETFFSFDNPTGKKVLFNMGWCTSFGGKATGRVNFEALSGGERTLFLAALAYAFLALANPKLKVLMIEAAEIDNNYLQRLFHCCRDILDKGGIDNVIIATHVEGFPDESIWSVHRLEAERHGSHREPAGSH